jgi:alpha-tubulin suppressor-like RCC1 family protein
MVNVSVFLDKAGKLMVWGTSLNSEDTFLSPTAFGLPPTPTCENPQVSAFTAGLSHCVVLTEDGHVFTWGSNIEGQLGVDGYNCESWQLVIFPNGELIKKVAAGGNFTIAISTDDDIFSWGENNLGQLGLGDFLQHTKPTQVCSLCL